MELVKSYCTSLVSWSVLSHCAVELAVTVVSYKVDSFPYSLLVSCEDGDQSELPLYPPPGLPLHFLHL